MNLLKTVVLGIMVVFSGAVAAVEPAPRFVVLDIPAQPLSDALSQFAKQSGLQIVFHSQIGKGVTTSRLSGRFTPQAALDRLLRNTGLEYSYLKDDAVAIRSVQDKIPSAEAGMKAGGAERPSLQLALRETGPSADPQTVKNSEDESRNKESTAASSTPSETAIVVTGTRLRNVSPASPSVVITRDEIDQRGYNSIEDILRALPQNYSGFNSSSHADGTAPRNSEGAAVANLRGLGMGSTLILVNGRRTAASPAENLTYTDISTIPFGAIERVEILPDGGSAVYGADAVAGVINFILRKDYSGAESRLRYENSSADADNFTAEQLFGFNWASGNLTGSLRYEKSDPTSPDGVGIYTLDHRSRGGRDFRNSSINALVAAGSVTMPGAPAGTRLAVLPAGDGVGLTAADLAYVSLADYNAQSGTYNLARPSSAALTNTLSPDSKVMSGSFVWSQNFSGSIKAYLEGSYARRETEVTSGGYSIGPINVPITNIYNTFGQRVRIAYDFSSEVAMGTMPAPVNYSEATRYGLNAGLEMELPVRDWQANLNIGYSKDATTGTARSVNWFGSDSDGGSGPGAASYNAYNAAIENNLNLFGDGTAQLPPAGLAALIYARDLGERTSDMQNVELNANGSLLEMAGGDLGLVLGLEYREEELDNRNYASAPLSFEGQLGVPGPDFVPTRELKAVFFELGVPLVGANNRRAGIQALSLTLQGRYERYKIAGPLGPIGIDFSTGDFTFPENIEVPYSKFSPKLGLSWRPIRNLKLRTTWGQGFQSPTLPELFTPAFVQPTFGYDPLAGANGPVAQFYGGNPELKPQDSETLTLGFDYAPSAIPGLTLSATWLRTEFNNQIGLPAFSLGSVINQYPTLFPDLVSTTDAFVDLFGSEITLLNYQFGNIGNATSKAADFNIDYAFNTGLGAFSVGAAGTYTFEVVLQLLNVASGELPPGASDAFTQSSAATNFGPDRLKLNSYIDWSRGPWNANVFVRFSSGYNHFGSTGVASAAAPRFGRAILPVTSYTTVDTQINRTTHSGWKVGLGVKNLFNQDFPFVNVALGADSSRVDFRRRVVYLAINKSFDF